MREEGGGLGVKGWGGKGQGKRGRKGGTRTGPTKLGRGWKFKWYYILDKCKLDLNKWPIDRQQTHISFINFWWENEHERKSFEEWLRLRIQARSRREEEKRVTAGWGWGKMEDLPTLQNICWGRRNKRTWVKGKMWREKYERWENW